MEKNYITKNKLIKEDDVKKMLKSQSFEGNTEMVYILPEVTGEKDLINEFSPNLYKVAKANNIPCTIIIIKRFGNFVAIYNQFICWSML